MRVCPVDNVPLALSKRFRPQRLNPVFSAPLGPFIAIFAPERQPSRVEGLSRGFGLTSSADRFRSALISRGGSQPGGLLIFSNIDHKLMTIDE